MFENKCEGDEGIYCGVKVCAMKNVLLWESAAAPPITEFSAAFSSPKKEKIDRMKTAILLEKKIYSPKIGIETRTFH